MRKYTKFKIDNVYYTLEELKKGYEIITGLDNVEEFTSESLYNYMKNVIENED